MYFCKYEKVISALSNVNWKRNGKREKNEFAQTERMHGKNDFAEISKNLARYRSENNFVRSSKYLCRKLKHDKHCCKKF